MEAPHRLIDSKFMQALTSRWGRYAGTLGVVLIVGLIGVPPVRRAVIDIQLLYRVETELLIWTPEGSHYLDLFSRNAEELVRVWQADPSLAQEGLAVIELWQPNLQALVDGKGGQAVITGDQVQAVTDFLDQLSAKGSPTLRQVIASERARKPLEPLAGLTMDQAYEVLIGSPPVLHPNGAGASILALEHTAPRLTWTVSNPNSYIITWLPPLNGNVPYETKTGKVIPVAFTIEGTKENPRESHAAAFTIVTTTGYVWGGPIGIGEVRMDKPGYQGQMYYDEVSTKSMPDGCYLVLVSEDVTHHEDMLAAPSQFCIKSSP